MFALLSFIAFLIAVILHAAGHASAPLDDVFFALCGGALLALHLMWPLTVPWRRP